MGHIQTVEQDFRRLLAKGNEAALVRFVKDQVLASYRNGLAARNKTSGEAAPQATAPKKRGAEEIIS